MKGQNERGQVTPLILGLSLVTIAVVGVAVDGTRAFLLRRSLQNAADAAALAGAAEVDTTAYYSSGGKDISLEERGAARTARDWLRRQGIEGRPAVVGSGDEVHVVLRGRAPTTFLRLVGISHIPVAVEARAAPVAGE